MTLVLAAQAGSGGPPVDVAALLAVLVVAWTAGRLATRLGYPSVLGELLAGIILGPPVLGLLYDGAGLDVIGELGIVLMMLWIGTEIDLSEVRKASHAGLLAAIGGFVVPFVGGMIVMRLFGFSWVAAVFVGAAVGVTSLATKSRILADLDLFDTRIAYVMMAGALLSDTATLVVFAGVLSFGTGEGAGLAGTLVVAGEALLFFAIAAVAALLAPRAGGVVRRFVGNDGAGAGLMVMLAMGLGGAALAELLGLHAILGSFVAGMVIRRGMLPRRAEKQAGELLQRLSLSILAPVFFTTAGFAIDLGAVTRNLPLVLSVIAVASLGKVIGTALAYLPTGHGWREGVVVGGAMNGRGAVEIVVAGIGVEQGLISAEVFTVLVVMAVVTTASVPITLKLGVEWLRSRGELVAAGESRRGVTIIGAGALARSWALALGDDRPVRMLDSNADRVHLARAAGLHASLGDATDLAALREAGAEEAGLVLALTPNLQVNLMAGQLLREEFNVSEVRVALGGTTHPSAQGLLARYGCMPLGDAPVDVDRWSTWLETGTATITSLVVTERTDLDWMVTSLRTGEGSLPVAVRRGQETLPFSLVAQLQPGDELRVVVRTDVSLEQDTDDPVVVG